MSDGAAFSFAIVCEGPADYRTATELADLVICDAVDWITSEALVHFRHWRGFRESDAFLAWREAPALARDHGILVHGKFGGLPDFQAARSALLLFKSEGPEAVVFVRDSDGDLTRREGLERARLEASPGTDWPFPVLIGLAHTKRECWVLAGFDPRSESEIRALAEFRQELGFDPCLQAQDLTASKPQAKRNAKRVLGRLLGGSREREEDCWRSCDLALLAERGRLSGLAEYLEEVRSRLVPIFTTGSRRRG